MYLAVSIQKVNKRNRIAQKQKKPKPIILVLKISIKSRKKIGSGVVSGEWREMRDRLTYGTGT
jgi:hypothetical protein